MQILKAIIIWSAGLILTACATTAPNPLNAETRDQFFVKSTQVTWNLSEKEQAIEEKKDANDQGKRAAGRKIIEDKLTSIVSQEFANSPSGPTPVDFNIAIKRYHRVGNVTGNLLGVGSDFLAADVIVTDSTTGQELAVYEEVTGYRQSGGGVIGAVVQAASDPDIEGVMALKFSERLRKRFDKKK